MKSIRFATLSLSALGLAFSSSCSTTKGFGQDLQKVGDRIETRADATGGTARTYSPPVSSAPSTGLTPPVPSTGAGYAY